MKPVRILFLLLSLLLIDCWALRAQTYTTNFPATENPISEGGKWVSGSAAGTNCVPFTGPCWGDVQTTPGKAFGTVNSSGCQGQQGQNCNDSTAALTNTAAGVWSGSDQSAEGTIFVLAGTGTGCCHEVEVRTNLTISSHSISGYELNCSVSGQGYLQLVRWEGPIGSFTQLNGISVNCVNGDKLKLARVGNDLVASRNGSVIFTQANETKFMGGSPGISFFDSGDTNYSNFGFSAFTATGQQGNPPPTGNQIAAMQLSIAVSTTSPHKVTLNWTGVTTCVDGSTCTPSGYNVYRGSTVGSGQNKIGATANPIVTFVDTAVTPGVTYYYYVTAFLPACTTGQTTPCGESGFSNQAIAAIPTP